MYPQFQISKNKRLLSHEHLTKKLRNCFFCHEKWGVDLYTGSTYTQINTVIIIMIIIIIAVASTATTQLSKVEPKAYYGDSGSVSGIYLVTTIMHV